MKYSGLDKAYFRTKNWLKVPGYVVVFDGEDAYGVEGHDVTIMYKNPYWEHNETPEFASVTATAVSGKDGLFEVQITLPPTVGAVPEPSDFGTHYYDVCGLLVWLTDNPQIKADDKIIQISHVS